MRDYFQPTPDLFSLCDMAFKYVVRSDDGAYFMQDSFELQELESDITKHTFDAFHRCPVCLDLKKTVEATDRTMYNHITTHHPTYPLADVTHPSPEAMSRTSDIEGADTDPALHPHSSSSDSSPATTLTSVDMSHRSHAPDPGESHELVQQMQGIQSLLTKLKFNAAVRPRIEAEAQAAFSQENYDKLQAQCQRLQAFIDRREREVHGEVDGLTTALSKMEKALAEHLQSSKQLEDHVTALNEDHRQKTEAMNEKHRRELQQQSQQHEDTLKEQLQPYIDNEADLRAQLAGLQQMLRDTHESQDANLAQQLLHANAEIERLQNLHAHPSPHSPAPDAELERLREENEDLQLQLSAHEAVDKSTVHSQSALANAQKTIRQQEKLIAQLRAEIAGYKEALEELRKQLEGLLRSQKQDAKDLHATVAQAVHKQIDIAGLVTELQDGNLRGIRAAVRHAHIEKVEYSPCALFLILESFGGTWANCLRVLENSAHSKYEARCKLIVEQLLYDLTMWDSIANEIKPTRYTSRHVTEFIKHFKLNPP